MPCENERNECIGWTPGQNYEILKELEIYASQNNIPIIRPEIARFLLIIGSILKPVRILEIGTAIGYSAIFLASLLKPGGTIDTIEKNERMVRQAKSNIKKAGWENKIKVIAGDALEVLPYLAGSYDMVFQDAAKGQYIEFLPDCLRVLRVGGILASDNVLFRGLVDGGSEIPKRNRTIAARLREYIGVICGSEMLDTSIIPIGDGLAVTYKKGEISGG
ncbi:MAG: O-methyltransferase [Eubacteriales bacterium]|nr:O-methyltransferase [Eubacteriales bacterium]